MNFLLGLFLFYFFKVIGISLIIAVSSLIFIKIIPQKYKLKCAVFFVNKFNTTHFMVILNVIFIVMMVLAIFLTNSILIGLNVRFAYQYTLIYTTIGVITFVLKVLNRVSEVDIKLLKVKDLCYEYIAKHK